MNLSEIISFELQWVFGIDRPGIVFIVTKCQNEYLVRFDLAFWSVNIFHDIFDTHEELVVLRYFGSHACSTNGGVKINVQIVVVNIVQADSISVDMDPRLDCRTGQLWVVNHVLAPFRILDFECDFLNHELQEGAKIAHVRLLNSARLHDGNNVQLGRVLRWFGWQHLNRQIGKLAKRLTNRAHVSLHCLVVLSFKDFTASGILIEVS